MQKKADIEQRKRQLIAEGAVLRAELVLTRRQLRDGASPAAIGGEAASMLRSAALNAIGGGGALGAVLPMLLPLLARGYSMLSGRPRLFRQVRNAAIVAVAAIAVTALVRKKKSPSASN